MRTVPPRKPDTRAAGVVVGTPCEILLAASHLASQWVPAGRSRALSVFVPLDDLGNRRSDIRQTLEPPLDAISAAH